MRKLLVCCTLVVLYTLIGGPVQAASVVLTPALLNYNVAWGGTTLGEGTLTLTPEGANCFNYELKTNPIGIVRWVYGSPREVSNFCVVNGVVVPSRHEFANSKRPKDGFVLDFDWKKGLVLGGRNGPLPITAGTLDRLSIHQAARLWVKQHAGEKNPGKFTVQIVDHKRIKSYVFAITGRGSVETDSGSFDAIRFERIDDPNTTLRFWLAPEKDYMPVRVDHVEDGETKLRLSLK